jgi:hypothetical protein
LKKKKKTGSDRFVVLHFKILYLSLSGSVLRLKTFSFDLLALPRVLNVCFGTQKLSIDPSLSRSLKIRLPELPPEMNGMVVQREISGTNNDNNK